MAVIALAIISIVIVLVIKNELLIAYAEKSMLVTENAAVTCWVVVAVVEVQVVVDVPVALLADDPVPDPHPVAGGQLPDPVEERLAVQAELEREVVAEAGHVRLDGRQERQQRLVVRYGRMDIAIDRKRLGHAQSALMPAACATSFQRAISLVIQADNSAGVLP